MYYLYVKTHNKTGLKYLGKTIQDPFKYRGSGTRWLNHIKKHGNDVSTRILLETEDEETIRKEGIQYSEEFDIVASDEWANLKIEEGDGGWSHYNSTPEAAESRKRGAQKGGKIANAKRKGHKNPDCIFNKNHPRYEEIQQKAKAAIKKTKSKILKNIKNAGNI